MATNLADIFCTEKDKVNCSFFYKIGACRHAEKCTRLHHRPTVSQTVLLAHMYRVPPKATEEMEPTPEEMKEFDDFYEDVFLELCNIGEIQELKICENVCSHLIGNIYCKFFKEEAATDAVAKLDGRFFAGKPIHAELSPVTDFREARCRQFDMGNCNRGGYCNFMHLKHATRDKARELFAEQDKAYGREYRRHKSRSLSPMNFRSRSRSRSPRDRHHSRRDSRRDDRHSRRSRSPRDRHHSRRDSRRGRSHSPRRDFAPPHQEQFAPPQQEQFAPPSYEGGDGGDGGAFINPERAHLMNM